MRGGEDMKNHKKEFNTMFVSTGQWNDYATPKSVLEYIDRLLEEAKKLTLNNKR